MLPDKKDISLESPINVLANPGSAFVPIAVPLNRLLWSLLKVKLFIVRTIPNIKKTKHHCMSFWLPFNEYFVKKEQIIRK